MDAGEAAPFEREATEYAYLLRLTLLEVCPGTRYADTVITEIGNGLPRRITGVPCPARLPDDPTVNAAAVPAGSMMNGGRLLQMGLGTGDPITGSDSSSTARATAASARSGGSARPHFAGREEARVLLSPTGCQGSARGSMPQPGTIDVPTLSGLATPRDAPCGSRPPNPNFALAQSRFDSIYMASSIWLPCRQSRPDPDGQAPKSRKGCTCVQIAQLSRGLRNERLVWQARAGGKAARPASSGLRAAGHRSGKRACA